MAMHTRTDSTYKAESKDSRKAILERIGNDRIDTPTPFTMEIARNYFPMILANFLEPLDLDSKK